VRRKLFCALSALFLVNFGCSVDDSGSCTESLAEDEKADNIAVLFADSRDGIPSAEAFDNDVNEMAGVLAQAPYNFKVVTKFRATPQDILNTTSSAASSLKANGTLLFFYSGHGDNGALGYMDPTTGSKEIERAASTGKYARLIMMIDACYSGSFVEGPYAIQRNSTSAYNGLLVMTAAKPNEESADDGISGFFAHNLATGLHDFVSQPTTKIKDLITWAFNKAADPTLGNPDQSGDYRADPPSILDELLVGGSPKPTPTPTVVPTTTASKPTTTITPKTGDSAKASAAKSSGSSSRNTCRPRS
jgi:hypothetical protein